MTTITRPDVVPPAGRTLPAEVRPLGRLVAGERAWFVPAALGVLGLAAILYLVNLTVSGYANTYYAAAALAGAQSWSAWFFGSIDPANFITIDKPPLATMALGLSVRLFGLSSTSILLPEALMGVATVGVLMATVRRTFGAAAAVIAGLVAALTPAAVLIFRYDNPDALLTLLLVLAAYAFVRALEAGRLRWVILSAGLVGFAFLTKYLQAYLVLPAFAVTFAVAAPGGLRRRLGGLIVALGTVVLASGWWVAVMEALPAAARPFIGGSQTNSVLDLLFGYDGLGRIFGQGGGGGGGDGGAGLSFGGAAGLLRMFNAQFGGQVSWLLPFAGGAAALGLWARRHAPRTDLARAAYLMWGLWLAVHVLVFSLMSGIIHSYYTVVLAPAIGALVGGGMVELWRLRARLPWGGLLLGAALVGSALWAWQLLERTPDFAPGLGLAIVAAAVLVAIVLLMPAGATGRRPALAAAGIGLVVLLAGPAAYALVTMQTAYAGGDPAAGPAALQTTGGTGGPGAAPGFGAGGPGGAAGFATGGGPAAPAAGGDGGAGLGVQVDSALLDYLLANRGDATWIVAVNGANEAGSIQLATGQPVMAMGGFSGSDPAPTLEQLKAYVASGELRFVLVSSRGGGPGGASGTSDVAAWVTANGTVVQAVGNGALYDLSGAAGG